MAAKKKRPDLRVIELPEKRELAPEHREHLRTSGLSDERIDAELLDPDDVYDDDLALDDATVERQLSEPSGHVHADPWLARRALTFGASEVAALFVGYDVEDPALLGSYAQKNGARRARGRWKNEPRIVLEKAGILPPLKAGKGVDMGKERERELLVQWRDLVWRGAAGPSAALVDGDSIAYVPEVMPVEAMPLVSRRCPALAATPDVWARDLLGLLGVVELKCSMHPFAEPIGGHPGGGPRRQHVIQLHAQADVLGAEWLAVVEGEGWGADWRDHAGEPSGPIRTWPVKVDRALIATIHEVCTRAMNRVMEIREATKEAA